MTLAYRNLEKQIIKVPLILREGSVRCFKQIWKIGKVGKVGKVGEVGRVGKVGKVQ